MKLAMNLKFEHIVRSAEAGSRIDKLLGDCEEFTSRSVAARLLDEGRVTVNGMVASRRHVTRAGEKISATIPRRDDPDLVPEDIPLDIRYEDDDLIVLSKQAGLVVHPAHGNWTGTLVNALLAHSAELGTLQGWDRPGIVHRLDKDTTGLMLVAKNDEAQAALAEAIKIRAVDRRYIALVHGYIAPDTGLVDAPIARDPKDRTRMAVSSSPLAKQAVTTFSVLERFSAGRHDDGYTLVECKLYTGRTHQIRVHMSYTSHPVVGDQLYGLKKSRASRGLQRQFLHSYRLMFHHPATGAQLSFADCLPDDLADFLIEIEPESMGRTAEGERILPGLLSSRRFG